MSYSSVKFKVFQNQKKIEEDKIMIKKEDNKHKTLKGAKKAVFFLRHNNDIDHIVPVLYKWLSTENVPTDIIITTKQDFLEDFISFSSELSKV